MSMWKKILSTLFPGLVSSGLSQILGLTRGERQQNQFNAEQSAMQRQFEAQQMEAANVFNAEEAEKNRQFQAEQSATAYQRQVSDMKAAGVNPALMYGNGASGASTPSGSAATSAMASGSAASGSGRGVSMSELLGMMKVRKEIDLLDAQVRQFDAQTLLTKENAEYRRQELSVFKPMSELQMKNLEADLQSKSVRARLDESGIKVNEAEAALKTNQAMLAAIDEKTRAELNRLEIRQRIASAGYTVAQTNVAKKTLDKIDAEINELYQRAIEEAANSGRLDAETRNLLVQEGILLSESEDKSYRVRHKKLTFVLDCVGKTLGAVASAAGTFGALGVGSRAFGIVGQGSNAAAAAFSRQYSSPSVSLPMNAWTMRSYSGNYTSSW